MGRKAKHPFLKKRGNVWWIRVAVPRALRHRFTSPHVEQSLHTESLTEAEGLKLARVALVKLDFRRKMRDESGNLPADVRIAQDMRAHLKAAEAREDDEEVDLLHRLITDEAERIESNTGNAERGKVFAARAFGRATLREAWESWMQTADLTPGTQAKYRRAFDEFLQHLKEPDILPETVTTQRAQGYVDALNTETTLDPATKRGRVIALSAFWRDYLEPRGLVARASNPWRGHRFTGQREKARREKKERPYTVDEIMRVIHGPERGKQAAYSKLTMLELTALGLYSGARLDELCSRKVGDLEPIHGGYVMHIREGKTADAVRSLPILHDIPVTIIRRRIGKRTNDPEAFLFAEFVPGGPDNKRSWQVQKALGDYRRKVELPEGVDFHSTRRTFATRMEGRAEINPVWVTRYFGHRPAGLMAGTYAAVQPENLRKVAQAICYPANIERAFRAAFK